MGGGLIGNGLGQEREQKRSRKGHPGNVSLGIGSYQDGLAGKGSGPA